ncbi:MAG: T9SS type A sorting domain-containing protein [Bacteroidia bacterium]
MKKLLLTSFILLACFTGIHAQWTQQTSNVTPGYYVPFLDAVNSDIVWGIVSDPANQQTPVAEYTKTVDGGNLWIGGAITNAAGLAPSCIFGLNADTAWVAMWNVAGGAAAGKILRTNDGGGTWTQQTTALFNTAGNFPNWVYFWDANNGVCLGDPTGGYFEIYTTVDGGTNWVRTPQADIAAQLGGEFGITDVFREFGDSTLYFGTNQGRIYKTVDRGLHFTAAQTPFTDFIGAIAFRDANNGLCVSGGAVGSTDVAYTTDGGATWNLKGTNAAGMSLILGLCYLPGSDSTYFISTPAAGSVDGTAFSPNDGTSWVTADNLIHTDIEFVNDSTGWTGSNELNAPMMKWTTPVIVAADDAASSTIDVPLNAGTAVQNPLATFVNNGLNTQTFDVTMTITGGYTSTKTITGLVFNITQQVTFDPWTPAAPGIYTITIYTSLGPDSNHNNDTLQTDVTVYPEFENYGWVSKPDISTATFGLGGAFWLNGNSTSSPGQLFSIGGADFAAIYPNNNTFFTVGNSWSIMPSMPTGKFQFSLQRAGNKIYAAGGYNPNFSPVADMYIYDIASNSWSTGSPMLVAVGDYASGVYNDSLIYYIGGYSGSDENTVQIYNTNTDTWTFGTSTPGIPTSGLRGGIIDNKIVLVGGYSQTLANSISDAYIGDIDPSNFTTITWNALPPYPGGTVGRLAAGVPYKGVRPLVIFVGGDPNGGGLTVKKDCWGYDVSLNQWLIGREKITAVSNISDFAGVVYNDSLWMASVAGYDGINITTVHEWLNLGASPPLGIDEHNSVSNDQITLYPNPAQDEIVVSIKENNNVVSLLVTDVSGRVVKTVTVSEGQKTIRVKLANLDAGVYILSVMKQDGSASGYMKFVKE